MYRITIYFLILISTISLTGQDLSFQELDSKTYSLYMDEKWDELIDFGESIESEEIDYYYHNIRMGIAYYNKHQFYAAEKYLLKAIDNNDIDFPKQYLMWTYQYLGENIKADQVYDKLSDETRENLKYKKKAIELLYLEGGSKKSSSSGINPTLYGKVEVLHRLFGNSRLTHAISTYRNNSDPLKTIQNQYHLMVLIPVKKNLLNIGGLYGVNGESSRLLNESDFTKTLEKSSYGMHINYITRFNRFGLVLGLNYLYTITDSLNITPRSSTGFNNPSSMPGFINPSYNEKSFITLANFNYSPKVFKDKIKLGLENYFIFSDEGTNYTFRPYMNISMGKKLLLNANYIHVGNYTFWDKTTDIIYNDAKYSIDRYAATLYFFAFSKASFNLTYIFEQTENRNLLTKTNINSIYLGVLMKF